MIYAPAMQDRRYTFTDTLILRLDGFIRRTAPVLRAAGRPLPALPSPTAGQAANKTNNKASDKADNAANNNTHAEPDSRPLTTGRERRHVAGLMRINHAGEVAAQGLYHGQALLARQPALRARLLQAAREEGDHLAWCARRLEDLGSRTSYLDPAWYAGAFALGAVAGLCGDRWSLGFIMETEQQVEAHLDKHLALLPPHDRQSRAILEAIKQDEAHHAATAQRAGARELPAVIKRSMGLSARLMTGSAYYI